MRFYRLFRAVMSLALRLFFRFESVVDPHRGLSASGPVIFVGNHPNGLMDPAVLFVLARREVTFLAKEPLFRIPVLGSILRGLGALPVFRKQDGPGDTTKNEGTLTASVDALIAGRAITIFPEGKSHSEPQLAELKTGAARIALDAARKSVPVRIVPFGITYDAKARFGSKVHVEVGAPIDVQPFLTGPESPGPVRALTEHMAAALRAVTLNLEAWEDLPLLQTAEQLYALEQGQAAGDPERLKAFARGMQRLRAERPEVLESMRQRLLEFRLRLGLLRVTPDDLSSRYRPLTVAWFVLRNALWLTTVPLLGLGLVLFCVPYFIPAWVVRFAKPSDDTESTIKLLVTLVVAPLWWGLLTALAGALGGLEAAVATFLLVPPLALFTRWWLERRAAAVLDARAFVVLMSHRALKAALLAEGEGLAQQLVTLAAELGFTQPSPQAEPPQKPTAQLQ